MAAFELSETEIRTALSQRVEDARETLNAAEAAAGLPLTDRPDAYTIGKRLERMSAAVAAAEALSAAWTTWRTWEYSITPQARR